MKKAHMKTIAWVVMLAFIAMMQVSQTPLRAAPAGDKGGGETVSKGEGTGYIEQEQAPPAKLAKKKFPWLIVLGGVVVAAAVIYFVVLNKKYTLTVTLGEGVTGTPAAGSASYKKNSMVNYSYSLQGGYKDLAVTLDGSPVPASGSVKMDKAHTLAANSTKTATVAVNSTPTGAKIYDNGVDTGHVTNWVFNYSAAGLHNYILRQCGYQDGEFQEAAEMGAQKTINASLAPGIYESFTAPAASCWAPHTASEWTVSGGTYRFASSASPRFSNNKYNFSFSQSAMTAEARMKRVLGNINSDNAVALLEKLETNNAYGYWFSYTTSGHYFIVRLQGYDIVHGGGNFTLMAQGTATGIVSGLDKWNTVKVVRSGSSYSLYFNGILVTTISDNKYTPHYMVLGIITASQSTQLQYDWVRLSLSGASAPAAAVSGPAEVCSQVWPVLK